MSEPMSKCSIRENLLSALTPLFPEARSDVVDVADVVDVVLQTLYPQGPVDVRLAACLVQATALSHELGNLGLPMRKASPPQDVLMSGASDTSRVLTRLLTSVVELRSSS